MDEHMTTAKRRKLGVVVGFVAIAALGSVGIIIRNWRWQGGVYEPTTVVDYLHVFLASAAKPKPRQLDSAPVEREIRTPLPPNVVHAFFAAATGGDQMGGVSKQAGLELIVRYDRKELRQTVASCEFPELGSVLGGGEPPLLEVAGCDSEYHLVVEPGEIYVRKLVGSTEMELVHISHPYRNVVAQRPVRPM